MKVRSSAATAALSLSLVALAMLGASFAAVPLYKLFCQVTGYGGVTREARAAAPRILDRTISVRLDANVAPGLPVVFKAERVAIPVRFGQTSLAYYTLTNTSLKPVRAIASYNVAPHKMGPYFQKLECFCFREQDLAPHESRELAVMFFVHPDAAEDWETHEVRSVTLSYTFYEARRPQQTAQNTVQQQP